MSLALLLIVLPLVLAGLGVRDLLKGDARDLLSRVLGIEGLFLASALSLVLLDASAARIPILLLPLVGVPFVWSSIETLIPQRLRRLRASLSEAEAEGTLLMVIHDELDRRDGRDTGKRMVALGLVLTLVMGVAGLQFGNGVLLAGSALSALFPLARLARWHVEEREYGYLRRALVALAPGDELPEIGGDEFQKPENA